MGALLHLLHLSCTAQAPPGGLKNHSNSENFIPFLENRKNPYISPTVTTVYVH